ncbi:MAG: universal stress protein [Micrococcales bacterium]|nr:universal stress protein [Micrococcales bacterium]
MTRGNWALTASLTGIVARDVVAGLLGSEGAQAVARAAVQAAASRGARVRFLQVIEAPAGADVHPLAVDGATDERNAAFTAALRALREFPRVPVTFELAAGDPGPVLVERSADAGILVLAATLPEDVTSYCQRHAACDILTVRPTAVARLA